MATAADAWQHNEDLLFAIFGLVDLHTLASVLHVSRAWRAAALQPDLRHWCSCSEANFLALEPPRESYREVISLLYLRLSGTHTPWSCAAVARLAASKPRLQSLDLTNVSVSDAEAAARMSACLPATLECLAVTGGVNQPDALLRQLVDGLEALPRLRQLDLRG
eukprot:7384639-Prymnesium_polylepis.1